MLRLTGRKGDGWLPSLGYLDPADAAASNLTVDEAARKAGRDPREIRRSTTVSADFVTGKSEKEQRARLEELRALGITDFYFHTPMNPEEARPFVEKLIPELREMWG